MEKILELFAAHWGAPLQSKKQTNDDDVQTSFGNSEDTGPVPHVTSYLWRYVYHPTSSIETQESGQPMFRYVISQNLAASVKPSIPIWATCSL